MAIYSRSILNVINWKKNTPVLFKILKAIINAEAYRLFFWKYAQNLPQSHENLPRKVVHKTGKCHMAIKTTSVKALCKVLADTLKNSHGTYVLYFPKRPHPYKFSTEIHQKFSHFQTEITISIKIFQLVHKHKLWKHCKLFPSNSSNQREVFSHITQAVKSKHQHFNQQKILNDRRYWDYSGACSLSVMALTRYYKLATSQLSSDLYRVVMIDQTLMLQPYFIVSYVRPALKLARMKQEPTHIITSHCWPSESFI